LSSILRALKKIQTDTKAPEGIQAGPGMSASARVRESSYLYKGILAAAVMMGVAFGSVWVIKSTSKSQPEVSKPTHEAPELSISPEIDLALQETPGENTAQTQIAPVQKEEMPVTKPPAIELMDKHTANEDHSEMPNNVDMPTEGDDIEDIKKPEASVSERIISPDKETVERRVVSNYTEIDESVGLDLQAISWAADTQKRLAIINGTLCRENESVSGFIIKQINPDDVIVSNGSTTGRLVLKIR
jgi:hypothetical protein